MALVFIERSQEVQSEPQKGGFNWDDWYAKNKKRLSEKRAKRYREDADYRQKALERSRKQRAKTKEPVTDGFTISFQDVAKELGITVWQLREWRRKDYFPEPTRREGRMWFKSEQLDLLRQLKGFFDANGNRVVESKREALEGVVSLVYSNWN